MRYSLPQIFDEFCNYLDGKIKWSAEKKNLTRLVFEFFSHRVDETQFTFVNETEYMNLDLILRHKMPEYSDNLIELALEHEVSQRKPFDFLSNEVQKLIDIKAKYKCGIFYPSAGDEEELKDKIQEKIKQASYLSVPWEEYLFIFGFPTTQGARRSILFKAVHFTWERHDQYQNLRIQQLKERVIKQTEALKRPTL